MARPALAHVSLEAIRHNVAHLRSCAPDSRLMAVVKANAYGHGLERILPALSAADGFGVACESEATRLREAGVTRPILLLSGFNTSEELARLRARRIAVTIHHSHQLDLLKQAGDDGPPVQCWIKLDTGMHRLGLQVGELPSVRDALARLPWVEAGIPLMSHFSRSDEVDIPRTAEQIACFDRATQGLPGPRSLANSAAVLAWPDSHLDWIRPGGALYGLTVAEGDTGERQGLRAAMTFSTALVAVKHMRAGDRVGYGTGWQCPVDMPVGVAAAGYGDGYPRHAPSGTPVLIGDTRLSLIGRVSMDLITIDLRNQPDARVGDRVTLWGDGLPVEEVARAAGTISYELTCGIANRVQFTVN